VSFYNLITHGRFNLILIALFCSIRAPWHGQCGNPRTFISVPALFTLRWLRFKCPVYDKPNF